MKKVYIAGPDIFSLQWPEHCEKVHAACKGLSLQAVYPISPLTNLVDAGAVGIVSPGNREDSKQVYKTCLSLLRGCDAVVANLNPFRGSEPDSGTVFEVATAVAIGIPVVGYWNVRNIIQSTKLYRHNARICQQGYLVEKFDLPCNVMVAEGCTDLVFGDVVVALSRISDLLLAGEK